MLHRPRLLSARFLWACLLGTGMPACDITASQDATESISAISPYGTFGSAGPATSTDFGNRLGPANAPWSDTISPLAAPLAALPESAGLPGSGPLGPDVIVGNVAVLQDLGNKVAAFDLGTRAQKWSSDVQFSKGWLASDGKQVCGPEPGANAVTCLDLADGKLKFRAPVPHAFSGAEFTLHAGTALQVGSQGANSYVDAVDLATGQVLYQVVAGPYQRTLFPCGEDLVLSLGSSCPAGATDCLASVDPRTGTIRGSWPHTGMLLWRAEGKAWFASRDASYQRTIIALDESSHTFSDVSASFATLLATFQPMPNDILGHLAGPGADGGVYLNAKVFSSGGGKLCRIEPSSQKLSWCVEGENPKIRVHPNAVYMQVGNLLQILTPATGSPLASANGFNWFFGHWGFHEGKILEVH